MNFNEIIETAMETADRRKKAFVELKKAAPDMLKAYATAMIGLGYKDSKFKGKLFHDQAEFPCYNETDENESWVRFDFKEMTLVEATEEEEKNGEMKNVYDGTVYALHFSGNTDGAILLKILESLQKSLEKCVKIVDTTIEQIENVLAKS